MENKIATKFEITIKGSGTRKEILTALQSLCKSLKGKKMPTGDLEDEILMTEIDEIEE